MANLNNSFGKMVCPKCNGNGYITRFRHVDIRKSEYTDCDNCNNQGEIEINEETLAPYFATTKLQ